jgi:hypothetical protein
VQRPPVSGVVLAADKRDHFHDEFVSLTLRAESPEIVTLLRSTGPYRVWVEREGVPVVTVGQMETATLSYNAGEGLFEARWPVPWNAPDGEYTLHLATSPWPAGVAAPETLPFRVISRGFDPIPPGFAALTLEGFRRLDGIPGPDGIKSISGFPAWAEFMGADALFVQGGESSGFESKPKSDFPWSTVSFKTVRELGQECRRWGLKMGVYVLCYMVGGPPELAADYEYGWNYDAKGLNHGLKLQKRRGISIADPKRPGDIAAILKKFQAMPEVDWLGLDYIRPAFGSCELVEDFVDEMPAVVPPPNYKDMSPEDRMRWACRGRFSTMNPAQKKLPNFVLSDQWLWYRAHRTAEVVRAITQAVGEEKPFWAFNLSWDKGWEHGQDPNMMRDAGLDVDAIMLYEADEPMFRGLLTQWHAYSRRDQVNLMVGNQLDWYLHQKTLNPSGPEAYADRILRAVRGFHADNKPVRGVFIHDIHRLLTNGHRKGPYKTLEWALAAGHAITQTRVLNNALPYTLALQASTSTVADVPMEVTVGFGPKTSDAPVSLEVFAAPDVEITAQRIVLDAGAPTAVFLARWKPNAVSAVRGNRSFVAIRAVRPEKKGEKAQIYVTYFDGFPAPSSSPNPPK